jgi:hypothetical protein
MVSLNLPADDDPALRGVVVEMPPAFLEVWRERDGWAGEDGATLGRMVLVANAISRRLAEWFHDVGREARDPASLVPEAGGTGIDEWSTRGNAEGWSFPHPDALAGGPLLLPTFRLTDDQLERAAEVGTWAALVRVFGEKHSAAGWLRLIAERAATVDPPVPGEAERLEARLAALPPVPDAEAVLADPLAAPLIEGMELARSQAWAVLDPALYNLARLRLARQMLAFDPERNALLRAAEEAGDPPPRWRGGPE